MSNFSGFIESKEDADEDADKQIGQFAKKMPEASDNGSQPYRNAVRCFEPTVTVREARESKWLVWDCPPII